MSVDKYIEQYYQSKTYDELAAELNVETAKLRRYIHKLQREGKLDRKYKEVTDKVIKKARYMNRELGIPINQVSKQLGYSHLSIERAFQRNEIPIRRFNHKWTDEDRKTASELRYKGLTYKEIADFMERPVGSIRVNILMHRNKEGL